MMDPSSHIVFSQGENVLIPKKLLPRAIRCANESLDQVKSLLSKRAWRVVEILDVQKIGDFAGWGPWDFREKADCSEETAEELFRILCFPEKGIRVEEGEESKVGSTEEPVCLNRSETRVATCCVPPRLSPQMEERNNLLGPAVLRPDVRRNWELENIIFSTRARSTLAGLGCKTVGDVEESISEWADLMRRDSCGETTANEIWEKLFAPNGSLETKIRLEGDERPAPTLREFLEKQEGVLRNQALSEAQRKSLERRLFAFKRRLDGFPLREIAEWEGQDCSVEMVRQRIEKTLEECPHLREDEFLEDFQKAEFGEFDFCQEFGVSRAAYYFLVMRTKRPRPQKPAFSRKAHERIQTVLAHRFAEGYSPTETFWEFRAAWAEEFGDSLPNDFPDNVIKEALDRYSVHVDLAEKTVYHATRRLVAAPEELNRLLARSFAEWFQKDGSPMPLPALCETHAETWKSLGIESPLLQRKILKLAFASVTPKD